MPLYDGDLEESGGIPEKAKAFKELMKSHHGFLIASPEYNSFFPPLLKNLIDWASRKEVGELPLECFRGKTAALLAASPGALGGLRGLLMLRQQLSNLGVYLVPDVLALPQAHTLFENPASLDPAQQARMEGVGSTLAQFTFNLIS